MVQLIGYPPVPENCILIDRDQLEAEVVALYEEHAGGLTRYATNLARSNDMAADALQETFLRYFAERTYGRDIDQPRAWMFQVMRNYLLDRLTSASATRESGGDDLSGLTDPGDDPEDLVHRSEIARSIAASLSTRERECLGLRSEGFSYSEIADVMGLRIGTVGALLARAHQKIRTAATASRAEGTHVAGAVHDLFHGGDFCPSN